MSTLEIRDLHVTVETDAGTTPILNGITLTVRNLERLGEYSYVYDFDEFGTEMLEEIGKAILAQPHKLRTLGRRQAQGPGAWSGPERRSIDADKRAEVLHQSTLVDDHHPQPAWAGQTRAPKPAVTATQVTTNAMPLSAA